MNQNTITLWTTKENFHFYTEWLDEDAEQLLREVGATIRKEDEKSDWGYHISIPGICKEKLLNENAAFDLASHIQLPNGKILYLAEGDSHPIICQIATTSTTF